MQTQTLVLQCVNSSDAAPDAETCPLSQMMLGPTAGQAPLELLQLAADCCVPGRTGAKAVPSTELAGRHAFAAEAFFYEELASLVASAPLGMEPIAWIGSICCESCRTLT